MYNVGAPQELTMRASYPTRRSSDLRIGYLGHATDEGRVGERVDRDLDGVAEVDAYHVRLVHLHLGLDDGQVGDGQQQADGLRDRKSIRLNSSHTGSSNSDFCLKYNI